LFDVDGFLKWLEEMQRIESKIGYIDEYTAGKVDAYKAIFNVVKSGIFFILISPSPTITSRNKKNLRAPAKPTKA